MALVEADVAYWDLARERSRLAGLAALLSPEETARAERLAIPVVRERFVLRHGILRETLGENAGRGAGGVSASTMGRTASRRSRGGDVGFNLSKSGDGLLIATARGAAVGCDLEQVRPNSEATAIAARWFSEGERAALGRLEGEAFDRGFMRLWVRKEALLKAIGTGLQGSLGIDTGDRGAARRCPAGGGRRPRTLARRPRACAGLACGGSRRPADDGAPHRPHLKPSRYRFTSTGRPVRADLASASSTGMASKASR